MAKHKMEADEDGMSFGRHSKKGRKKGRGKKRMRSRKGGYRK